MREGKKIDGKREKGGEGRNRKLSCRSAGTTSFWNSNESDIQGGSEKLRASRGLPPSRTCKSHKGVE